MCGIIGAIAQRNIVPILLEGLKRLEYRGYDSAGIAVINAVHQLERRRAVGKVNILAKNLQDDPLTGKTGIAHTRWATHGKPCEENAHPLFSHERIAVVHNGIIDNHEYIRRQLIEEGYAFFSDTDTEIIAHLLHFLLTQENNFLTALQKTIKQLQGAYALVIVDRNSPDKLFAVRSGSPLVIGLGFGENFFSSDPLALMPVTQRFIYLEDGDIACIEQQTIAIYDDNINSIDRQVHQMEFTQDFVERGKYRHYMLKEIFDQPEAVSNALEGRISKEIIPDEIFGAGAENIFSRVEHIQIAACGTSYHAGLAAKYWLEEITQISCQVEVASELRYRKNVVLKNTLFVTLSQSGETADTLFAQRAAKSSGYFATLSICNVPESSLIRDADLSLRMHAGPEIGVASTKAFTSQLTCLLLLAIVLLQHQQKRQLSHQITLTSVSLIQALKKLPRHIEQMLSLNKKIFHLAKWFEHKQHALFIGRGMHYPIALEGALKLKEISYIHAEGYPAGELKHGPLALLDKEMPVIVLAPCNELLEKLNANIQEIQARGAKLLILTDQQPRMEQKADCQTLVLPITENNRFLSPILYTIPLQLLAYHVAVLKGTDVDQPRNLAKSVTVE